MRDVHQRRIAVALCLTVLWSPGMSAQDPSRLRVGFGPPAAMEFASGNASLVTAADYSRTYWKEGGIAGGVLAAALGVVLMLGKDESGNRPGPVYAIPPLAALSFIAGFGPGALLGSLIPKPTRSTDS